MNYQHIYHAGNFTDVLKHVVLTLIIEHLRKKDAAFCYIDTHAGAGKYDLTSPEAQKTGEALAGVQKLLDYSRSQALPPAMQPYVELVKAYQTGGLLQYPGSPLLVSNRLRPQDRMILNEYHPAAHQQLKAHFQHQAQVAIHHRDAYEFLPAILPPAVSRGLVLIDPPFEKKDEQEKIQEVLHKSLRRWPHGVYMIWYPVTTRGASNLKLITEAYPDTHPLVAELMMTKIKNVTGLIGCQVLILNPPWQLAEALRPLLKYLRAVFSNNFVG